MRTHHSPLLTQLLPFISLDASPPEGEALGRALLELAACEVEEGGPYRSAPGQGNPDIGCNLVVALFLRRLQVRLPKLDRYLVQHLSDNVSSEFFDPEELRDLVTRYRSETPDTVTEAREREWSSEEQVMLAEVRQLMNKRLEQLPSGFRQDAQDVVERVIAGNPDKQMSLMPFFMREALGSRGSQFTDQYLAELGLANIFFWTAFIIYDDFWDEDEAAEARYLPVANLFARHYTSFFSSDESSIQFKDFFQEVMDRLDAANGWEITSCRMRRQDRILQVPQKLPEYHDFSIKFYPAAGHVLGPVRMLHELGYSLDSAEISGLIAYFEHYLVAMQLNDDAHDWKEDLERGHISTAVYVLLRTWQEAHPGETEIDIEKDMPELERLFWFDVLPELSQAICARTERAQRALDGLSCVESPAPLQQFIDRNRASAERALAEHRQSIAFLEAIESAGKVQE